MASCKVHAIFLSLVAVVRMSCSDAQQSNSALELLDFTVIEAKPPHYKVSEPTTVTFSANFENSGPANLTRKSGTVCVLFFDISTDSETSRNVGLVNITLPDLLKVDQTTYRLERETVEITLTQDACKDSSESNQRTLCAGIKSDGATIGLTYCLDFTDIDDGGAGEIDCSKGTAVLIPLYAIVLLVVFPALLVAVVVILLVYRKCHKKRPDRQSSPIDDLRRRFRSLPHIYADPSALDGESNYDSTIPKNAGSSNPAYQVESEPDVPYSTSLSLAAGGDKTIRLEDLLRKRPSQANEYTVEDSPFFPGQAIMEHSEDAVKSVHLEGVTEDESATDRKSVAFTGLVENAYETALDATPSSVEMTHSADFPKCSAPETKPDLQPAEGPNPEQFPSRPCPVVDINTPNQNLVPGVGSHFENSQNSEQELGLNPVPNQETDSFSSVPDAQSFSQEHISILKKPTPVPKPRKISMTGNSVSENPVITREVGATESEATTWFCDDPYLPPKPKVRTYSPDSINGTGHPAVPPKPPVATPRPPSFHNDQDDTAPPRPPRPLPWTGSQTETIDVRNTSERRPKLMQKPNLSLPRSDTEGKPNMPSKSTKSSAKKSNSDLDRDVLEKAITKVIQSRKRTPSDAKDPMKLLAEIEETNTQMADPDDPDFVDAVMQNYLSLVYETSRGDEEYEATMKRDLERIDSNTLSVEPQLEVRRKSLSAQLTLTLARKEKRSSEIYVNQWNKSWEFKRSDLEVDLTTPLGEGQFGKVYKGKVTRFKGCAYNMDVAIKVLKDDAGTDAKDEFLKELAIHTILKPNLHVVQLIGCCIRDDPIFILTEYLSGGNLLQYLRERPPHLARQASVQHYIAKFGLHIARGMAYVAKMKIVHRDLAARNILISEHEVCKVADFGFARDIFGLAYYPKSPDRAPIRWYAPEAILDDMFSTKSDVWSFGILLFEIATLGKVAPYRGMDNNQVRFSVSSAGHPKRPINCDDRLFKIMKICWAKDPEKRPTFQELVVIFEGIQDMYLQPIETDLPPMDPGLQQEVNPDPHQKVDHVYHSEFSPESHTVEVNPDLPSRVNNNPIPKVRIDPVSVVDPDPHPEVNCNPPPEVNHNPDPVEVNPAFPFTANTDLQPETTVDLESDVDPDPQIEITADLESDVDSDPDTEVNSDPNYEVNPDSDTEVHLDPLPEFGTDDVSLSDCETDEEESF